MIGAGTSLLHYRVVKKIGEGGMGAVWKATDATLGRDVAIKVLPEAFAADPERLARFEREAKLLAALNHPNIAAIFGFHEAGGARFLAMELVPGDGLDQRISRGPMPVDDALQVALRIAEALEYAHERGIVHRDLKPANVKITSDGAVKVLDFGLAKAVGGESGTSGPTSTPTILPTVTSAGTAAGMILGTAAYMSPEQARGKPVDKRSDIWAFGVVLFEMLLGRRLFEGETVSDTIAAVLTRPVDLDTLPRSVPASLRRLLARCLERDPKTRLRDIGEARIAIEDALTGKAEDAAAPPAVLPRSSVARRWSGIAVAVALTAIATLVLERKFLEPPPHPHSRAFEVIAGGFVPSSAVLSPDGRKIAFVRGNRLWLRHLDRLEPVRVEGTEGATHAAWSSDSESILFVAHGDLLSAPVAGGAPVTVAFGIGELGGAGGLGVLGDRVVFASGDAGIQEVSTRGGEPRDVVAPNGKTEADFHVPSLLPDGGILFVVHRATETADTIAVYRDGRTKYIVQTPGQSIMQPVYSPTGHLVYRRNGPKAGLWAAPFSLASLEVTGEPFLITTNGIFPSVAHDGTLLFVRNAGEGGVRSQLVWVERDGTIGDSVGPEMDGIAAPALSPDGKRVAIMRPETEQGNIWIFDIGSGARSRLTFGSPADWDPVWTADGENVVFWQGSTRALARIPADGSGQAERLVKPEFLDSGVPSISPDGKWMAFWARTGPLAQDVVAVELAGDGTPVPVVASPAIENFPRISPDGRYLAYTSNESGRFEIYLTRFPSGDGKWQISTQGGGFPAWSPVGDELFYLEGGVLKAVEVTLADVPRFGESVALFDAVKSSVIAGWNQRYEVSRDGKRFLMVKDRQNQDSPPGIVITYDWVAAARPR